MVTEDALLVDVLAVDLFLGNFGLDFLVTVVGLDQIQVIVRGCDAVEVAHVGGVEDLAAIVEPDMPAAVPHIVLCLAGFDEAVPGVVPAVRCRDGDLPQRHARVLQVRPKPRAGKEPK